MARTSEGKFAKHSIEELPHDPSLDKYYSAEETRKILFPSEDSRLSLKWFMRLRYTDRIPYRKFGRRLLFKPSEVQRALDKLFKIEARE